MSSAGRSGMSGMSDTERTNLQGERANPTGVDGPLMPGDDAPIDQVEMVEIVEVMDGTDDAFAMGPTGFRWWYVPAIGLPLGIGTGAAIWYLAKGEEPYQNAWELVTRPVRNRTGHPTARARTKKAMRRASATSDTLRDRMAGALSGFDPTDLAERAGDLWEDARESRVELWDQITDRDLVSHTRGTAADARDKAQRQLGKMAGNIAAAGAAVAVQKKVNDLFGAAQDRTKATGASVRGRAWFARNSVQAKANDLAQSAKRQLAKQSAHTTAKSTAKAVKVKSGRAVNQTRRRVTSPFRRMGTFALAALITAMIIYIRSWYSRRTSTAGMPGAAGGIGAEDMRQTAGGRMEPDTWPRFAGRAPDAAAPAATSSPTEPS